MTLKAWYPLNGTLEDYTKNFANGTASGASVSSSGIIGDCYSFTATTDYILLPQQTVNMNSGSLTFWINFDNVTTNQ
ncbi:MAG: hypothetical protein NWF07_07160, partial [Candidatus Bathyarchaeota archaeon]|nr:hypothetical protein [Candidatus Bathyarchaeota archaeon]